MTAAEHLRSLIATCVAAGTIVGLLYLAGKATLVLEGQMALVTSFGGKTRALGPGYYLLNVVGCTVRKFPMTASVAQLGNLTILRIAPGEVGMGIRNNIPVLLGTGIHVINDPLFKYEGTTSTSNPTIRVGQTLNIITIPPGSLGVCTVNAQGHFLGPGRHAINHPRFEFRGLASSTAEHLEVGSKHRVVLPAGRLGLAWDSGRPIILEPLPQGQGAPLALCIDNPAFRYQVSVPATQQVILHGSLKVITTRQGFVGLAFKDGVLECLPPGRHVLDKASHAFGGFIPTGQQTLTIDSVTTMTSDNIAIEYDAALTMQVSDARKAIVTFGTNAAAAAATAAAGARKRDDGADPEPELFDPKHLWTAVCARAKLALTVIIGSQRLNRGNGLESDDHHAQEGQPGRHVGSMVVDGVSPAEDLARVEQSNAAQAEAASRSGAASAPTAPAINPFGSAFSFRGAVKDQFLRTFQDSMLQAGILIIDMSLEDVRITSADLAAAMARGAVARADLAKANIELAVKRAEAQAEQQAEVMRAEGKARSIGLLAAAEADRVRTLDAALSSVKSPLTQQREMLLAAGEVMRSSKTSIVLARSPADAAALMAGGNAGGLSQLLA